MTVEEIKKELENLKAPKIYRGLEIDEDGECKGFQKFVIFGEMDDGSACYHKIVDGEEDEEYWYFRTIKFGRNVFFCGGR